MRALVNGKFYFYVRFIEKSKKNEERTTRYRNANESCRFRIARKSFVFCESELLTLSRCNEFAKSRRERMPIWSWSLTERTSSIDGEIAPLSPKLPCIPRWIASSDDRYNLTSLSYDKNRQRNITREQTCYDLLVRLFLLSYNTTDSPTNDVSKVPPQVSLLNANYVFFYFPRRNNLPCAKIPTSQLFSRRICQRDSCVRISTNRCIDSKRNATAARANVFIFRNLSQSVLAF